MMLPFQNISTKDAYLFSILLYKISTIGEKLILKQKTKEFIQNNSIHKHPKLDLGVNQEDSAEVLMKYSVSRKSHRKF